MVKQINLATLKTIQQKLSESDEGLAVISCIKYTSKKFTEQGGTKNYLEFVAKYGTFAADVIITGN